MLIQVQILYLIQFPVFGINYLCQHLHLKTQFGLRYSILTYAQI